MRFRKDSDVWLPSMAYYLYSLKGTTLLVFSPPTF
jgi:hypothetical protein